MSYTVRCECGHEYIISGSKARISGGKRIGPGTTSVKTCGRCTKHFEDDVVEEIVRDYKNGLI